MIRGDTENLMTQIRKSYLNGFRHELGRATKIRATLDDAYLPLITFFYLCISL